MPDQADRATPCCNSPYWHGCMTSRKASPCRCVEAVGGDGARQGFCAFCLASMGRQTTPCRCEWTPGIDLPTWECEQHRDDPTLAHSSGREAARSLRTRVMRLTWGGRDAHGSVPFDQKAAWQQGYDEAMRQVRHALDTIEQEDCDA